MLREREGGRGGGKKGGDQTSCLFKKYLHFGRKVIGKSPSLI